MSLLAALHRLVYLLHRLVYLIVISLWFCCHVVLQTQKRASALLQEAKESAAAVLHAAEKRT